MERLNRPTLTRLLLWGLSAAALACGAVSLFAVGALTRDAPVVPARAATAASAVVRPDDAAVPATELITITPNGFDPAEITRPAGRVILEVDNRGGLEEVTLLLERENGPREREARVRRSELDWRGEVTLRPGTYVLA